MSAHVALTYYLLMCPQPATDGELLEGQGPFLLQYKT